MIIYENIYSMEENMFNKKLYIIIILTINASLAFTQEDNKIIGFDHRITLGTYYSYTEDNIGIMEPMYDFVMNFPYISPNYNLLDFGIGFSVIMAFDGKGNVRLPVFGLSLNGSIRIYTPSVRKVRLFLEGIMSLVLYARDYPENGTNINGGWHIGSGIEYKLEDTTKIFAIINWFHNSNNDVYGRERNPAINAIGFGTGIQFH
jgi:hypothetical protein